MAACENFWKLCKNSSPLLIKGGHQCMDAGGILEYFKQRKDTLPQEHRTKFEQAKHFIAWQTMFNLLVGGYM